MSRNQTRARKFFSYYRPYLGLFSADMACAVIASAAMLAIPLCVRYITAKSAGSLSLKPGCLYGKGDEGFC